MIKKINITLALIPIILFCFVFPSFAQTENAAGGKSGGILQLNDNFSIFPPDKLGNSVYYKRKKLVSKEDLIIKNIVEAVDGYIYYGVDASGNDQLEYIGDPNTTFMKLEGGFYYLISKDRTKRSYYWINASKQIENLLPNYNTPAGFAYNGVDKAAFYHISKGETIELEDGTLKYQYTFRIHIADKNTYEVRTLPDTITDFYYKLRLKWLDPNTLEYMVNTGEKGTIEVW